MDTDRIRYFVTVVEAGSLTKASSILAISHSGLSKAISTLENETNLNLFRPQGRGIEITEEGKWFYQKSLEILRITNEIKAGKKAPQTSLRVGLSSVLSMTCASLMAAEFNQPIVFQEIELGEVEGKIVNDELDFGIAFIPSPKPELEYLELGEIQFGPFAREDLLNKHSITSLPYVVPSSEYPFNPAGYKNRDGWPNDVERLPYYSVSSFATALNLVRDGTGAVYMPDFVAAQENTRLVAGKKIVLVTDHKPVRSKRKVFLIKRQSVVESKEMKKFSRLMRKIANG